MTTYLLLAALFSLYGVYYFRWFFEDDDECRTKFTKEYNRLEFTPIRYILGEGIKGLMIFICLIILIASLLFPLMVLFILHTQLTKLLKS